MCLPIVERWVTVRSSNHPGVLDENTTPRGKSAKMKIVTARLLTLKPGNVSTLGKSGITFSKIRTNVCIVHRPTCNTWSDSKPTETSLQLWVLFRRAAGAVRDCRPVLGWRCHVFGQRSGFSIEIWPNISNCILTFLPWFMLQHIYAMR